MNKLVRRNNEEWVHTETGQIYTNKELEKANEKQMLEANTKYYHNAVQHDLDVVHRIIPITKKESSKKVVKEKYNFNMIHRTDVKELMLSGVLSEKECAFIGRFQAFICYPDNDLRIHNDYLSYEELGNVLGYSKNVMTKIIKSLEVNEIIKVVKGGNKPPIIYFNPFLYSSGREIDSDTYMMFCKSRYNPDINYYANVNMPN